MNMIGLVKRGAALVVSWDDAYVFARAQEHAAGRSARARSDSPSASTCGDPPARFASRRWAKATGTRWPPATAASPTERGWP